MANKRRVLFRRMATFLLAGGIIGSVSGAVTAVSADTEGTLVTVADDKWDVGQPNLPANEIP